MGFNRLILHIGTEKTGSSAIQRALLRNKPLLDENNIACMPFNPWLKSASNRKRLYVYKAGFWYKQFLPQADTVLLSSELFHSRLNTQERVDYLQRLVSQYFSHITIVCYVREQSSVCKSLYSTAIKNANFMRDDGTLYRGPIPSFEEFSQHCHPGNLYYNYHELLKMWQSAFGKDNLVVRHFDKSALKDGDLITDFFDVLGIRGEIQKDIESVNPSLNTMGIALGHAISQALPIKSKQWRKAMKHVAQHYAGSGPVMTQAHIDQIYTDFQASNLQLGNEYFAGKLLFKKPLAAEKDSCGDIDQDKVDELLQKILQMD